ncbi:hypothetical protein COOONC_11452 [Cooperia oncophora]
MAKVLFILNDRDDPTIVGGNHWSLLVFDRGTSRFEYYDSMRPAKDAVARQLVNIIKPVLDTTEVSFVIVDCPQQRNSFDCGMYVIEFVRHQLKLSEDSMSLGISSTYIESERQHWQDTIISLSKAHMITPTFSIVQDDKWLIFIIRAPYAKIADTEIEYSDDIFMFSAPPYYLRVHLPREVVDDNTGTAKYDSSLGEFTVRVPKKNVGENFPGLDMITELLNPQKKISAQHLVEEMCNTDDEEEDESEGSEYFVEQKVTDIQAGCSENCNDVYGYGFAWRRKGILGQLNEEIGGLVEITDPEHSVIQERSEQCAERDAEAFDAERYLLDLLEPEDALKHVLSLDFGLRLDVDADDRQRLKDFPRKRLPV